MVECKGSVSIPHLGNRNTVKDGISQQGTKQYANDIIDRLIKDLPKVTGDKAIVDEAKELATILELAKDNSNGIQYTLVNQRINGSTYFKYFQ